MAGHAYSRSASPSDEFHEHTDFLRWELMPDERVGAPVRGPRRWPRWFAVAALALAGGGWAMVDDKPAAVEWFSSQAASAMGLAKSIIGEIGAGEPAAPSSPPLKLAALQLFDSALLSTAIVYLPRRDVAANEVAAPVSVPEVANEGAAEKPAPETESNAAGSDKPAPLPPLPPLTDPLQKKAEAVGLHPELSRAVLESFTSADFKNAAIAIKKAIAETPEDGVLIWPPKPARGLARFRVHFVPGISPACRRYVVGVAKSGWLTTALPMERCGVKPRMARSPSGPRGAHAPTSHP
jgi:hypothetical protein